MNISVARIADYKILTFSNGNEEQFSGSQIPLYIVSQTKRFKVFPKIKKNISKKRVILKYWKKVTDSCRKCKKKAAGMQEKSLSKCFTIVSEDL